MLSGSKAKDPRRMMAAGMACLALALVWPRFVPLGADLGPDLIDGPRGVLFGLAVALNLWSAALASARRDGRG